LGANVVLLGRRLDRLEIVEGEIRSDGGEAFAMACDIREEGAVIAAVDTTLKRYGQIDGLVNNAGGQYRAAMKNISTKGFEAVVRNNLTGGFIFMRELYSRHMESRGGSIVNVIADIWYGWPEFAHSGAARGGMLTLTETAACEWAASGVRVNAVAPGGIASSGFDTYPPELRSRLFEYPSRIPAQRFGTESEVSAAIVFLLSPPRHTSQGHAFASTAARQTRGKPGICRSTRIANHITPFIERCRLRRSASQRELIPKRLILGQAAKPFLPAHNTGYAQSCRRSPTCHLRNQRPLFWSP
jgi:citronellol/citronellal dehydrogenase